MLRKVMMWGVGVALLVGSGCARTLSEDLCQELSAKGKECQDPLFTAYIDGMCSSLKGQPMADLDTLDRYREMSCAALPEEFRKDLKAALVEPKPGTKPR